LPRSRIATFNKQQPLAAIAVAHGLPLYTCNPADFAGIDTLEVVAVPNPDAHDDPSTMRKRSGQASAADRADGRSR
jgi:hypothetical protein